MLMLVQRFVDFTLKHKIIRGMISYGLLWPCGSLIEQTLIEKKRFRTYDWSKCLNYSLYGFFFSGPTIYVWIRVASIMWPRTDIRSSICKAVTEQVAYDPFAIATFLYVMSRAEGKTSRESRQEVNAKFLDAYKVGLIYWPCVQTINFSLVPLHNQVVFTSFFSMCWTSFLAYVKYLEQHPPVDLEQHEIDIHFLEP